MTQNSRNSDLAVNELMRQFHEFRGETREWRKAQEKGLDEWREGVKQDMQGLQQDVKRMHIIWARVAAAASVIGTLLILAVQLISQWAIKRAG